MRCTTTLAMAILITIGGTGVVLSNWLGSPSKSWFDPFNQQFVAYSGDLLNPYTDSANDTGFSLPANIARLTDWANSMTVSYNSPAPLDWPTYDMPATTAWANPIQYGGIYGDPNYTYNNGLYPTPDAATNSPRLGNQSAELSPR